MCQWLKTFAGLVEEPSSDASILFWSLRAQHGTQTHRKGKGENLFRKEHTCLRAHTPVSICVEQGLEKRQALQ